MSATSGCLPAVTAYIGLGGNLGAVRDTLAQAAERIDQLPGTRLLALSRQYSTPAWGNQQQPDFINAAASVRTSLAAVDLLQALLGIERDFGRDRGQELRWGPRTLDLDLLLYGEQVIEVPGLSVPHPRLHERAFALLPLLEIAPDLLIPGQGSARNAVSVLDVSNIHAL
ncbi:2-amino-4-hydroxy-6-hydroxymethyldihydropteridine diphosphokinase [Pseudoxanthomonas dokdonensis]|uniref:2-amino-4-hydroxy-6-hydroxymethyldihydropteridine pyrophosphokinase n=1 Tax=Pseudoxanthomonas dokdonensis TaxID=344882 RepID=A0A0R0CHZ9_9GAMM|nr:2-amino-4-hydroxy-6-hydroxymethyldihydropteridine diphosphokinase [Pseudoxanthomonas dokdonensis]KRG69205.1 2-amino-4-hydroxy-6-hydroxymethyldihydropteridine pyrophosphokinase [Pseudoxanthomonas dokdonensis]